MGSQSARIRAGVRTKDVLGWNPRAGMKKRCGQTKEPQLPRESLVGRIFLLAFFMIVISEGVDFGVSQLDTLT